MAAPTTPLRLLLVEDVPQVAQYVRGLLNAQSQIKLVDVVSDGRPRRGPGAQLRPDVVIVDWLPRAGRRATRSSPSCATRASGSPSSP